MTSRIYTFKNGIGKHYRKEAGAMKMYTSGDSIRLTEQEAVALKDKLILDVTPAPLVEVIAPEKSDVKLELRSLGGDKFNVINSETHKPINAKPLTEAAAKALIGDSDAEE